MLLVAHLQTKGVILNLEERFINRRSPLQSALFNRISPTKYDTTFILSMPDETNQLHGVVQTRTRHRKPEQDVIFISPVLAPGDGSHVIWQRLLTNACVKAKEAGIHRVYTRVDGTSDEFQIFKTIGFFPFVLSCEDKESLTGLSCNSYMPLSHHPKSELLKDYLKSNGKFTIIFFPF